MVRGIAGVRDVLIEPLTDGDRGTLAVGASPVPIGRLAATRGQACRR